ncbi:MAG TPA: efflux RND transporter permease subunit, partial [Terriglobales bacterium]|nr:efflux RND transporter permease subunit [Terriglobales bacterium]
SDLPNVDVPTIQVNAALPGASPETMASSVATPLERQFTTIAGITQMTSTRTYRQLAVLDKGIQPGERVIVDGQYRVIPNGKVQVVRTVPVTPKQVADNAPASGDPQ